MRQKKTSFIIFSYTSGINTKDITVSNETKKFVVFSQMVI